MVKSTLQTKTLNHLRDKPLLVVAVVLCFITVCSLWSFPSLSFSFPASGTGSRRGLPDPAADDAESTEDSSEPDFYDDPTLSYSIGTPVKDWDDKRREWLRRRPSIAAVSENKIVVVTGSQPGPCENPIGDHLQLRLFKNKVDYCRIHGCDVFYNNAFLNPKMPSVWAKLPPLRAAMVAHPEAEWIWWLDSDTVITDIDFVIPFEKYKNHNLIVNGWEDMIYRQKSWIGVNSGVFLLRNCQWSMDFIEIWANMSPINPNVANLTEAVFSVVTEKEYGGLDEQSSLVYLMITEKENWGKKIFIENEFSFSGYWLSIVDRLANITERYREVEAAVSELRRRRGEKESLKYTALWEPYLKGTHDGVDGWRRPFITHFTGCQPCSGHFNPSYTAEKCWKGMEKAFNFADNQVLRNYGFVHVDLLNSSFVAPLLFDSPA